MLSLSKKNILFVLFLLTTYLSSSCKKEQISPINQEVAFVKYYGHVGDQTATDVIRTSDGGYVLVGSTNSYSTREEMDILVVKTDSLGNELWSSAIGRTEGTVGGASFNYLRFDEEGVRIIELPDQSAYVLAANRIYYDYPLASSLQAERVTGPTKIVLYALDPMTGTPTIADGTELRAGIYSGVNSTLEETVSDMKIDTMNGNRYILTGSTNDIKPNKPNDNDNGAFDEYDVFTALLEPDFSIVASWNTLTTGFAGIDYASSVQILPAGYLITGITDVNYAASGQITNYIPNIFAVLLQKSGGAPLNEQEYGADDYHFRGGYSVYDSDDNVITIAIDIDRGAGSNGDRGKVGLFQLKIDAYTGGGTGINMEEVLTNGSTSPTNCKFYDLQDRNGMSGTEHLITSIALLPGREGYVLSSTEKSSEFESDICITKIDKELNIEEGWPYYFGYADNNNLVLTRDEAGTVLPVISGTSNQISISGYVFTGKFGLGTNNVMGLIRLNLNGALSP